MLLQAEQEAIARGCRGAWLDTYSFQARGFYERLGYAVFGILNDYPPGQKRIFCTKSWSHGTTLRRERLAKAAPVSRPEDQPGGPFLTS
jgi:ribosomal protein S18 acetylase RimI-like enzyme